MSINLLNLANQQLRYDLNQYTASFLGESESAVSKALDHLFPLLMSSLNCEYGKAIIEKIEKLDLDALSNISELFSSANNLNKLLNHGSGISASLFGNRIGKVIERTSELNGMKSGTTSTLLKLISPIFIGFIGNQIKE